MTAEKMQVQPSEKGIDIEQVKTTMLTVELVGDSELILCKKPRSFEMSEIWKQSHPKGEKMPAKYTQPYNLFENLITSIDWWNPIDFHDDDWSKYTKEELEHYLDPKVNAPCINAQHIFGSMKEAFTSFGFKDSTGKNGTDLRRGVSFSNWHYPIEFASSRYEQKLVPSNTKSRVNVLSQMNIFSGWRTKIVISSADVAMPSDTILKLLSIAGQFVGLATQRKNGFGRFKLGEVNQETM